MTTKDIVSAPHHRLGSPSHSVLAFLLSSALTACGGSGSSEQRGGEPQDAGVPIADGAGGPIATDTGASRPDDDAAAAEGGPQSADGSAARPLSFPTTVTYPCGDATEGVAVGDFDGDGKKDVAALSGSGVCVFLGNGDGSFQDAKHVPLFGIGAGIAARDLNGDGRDDLAATGSISLSEEGITVMLAEPGGSFSPPTRFSGSQPYDDVVLADVDGDGHADAVGATSGEIYAILLASDGSLRVPLVAQSFVGNVFSDIAVADLNGDGRADVVTPSKQSFGVILVGPGGTLSSMETFASAGGDVTLADFDRDGKLDVLNSSVTPGAALQFFRGSGDGAFVPGAVTPLATGATHVAVADIDGDRILDVVVMRSAAAKLDVLRGKGDGAFVLAGTFGSSLSSGKPVVADFNRDGLPDIVVGNTQGKGISVLINATK